MPAGFNQSSSDIESIVGVQFSIFSPEEIERSSVVEITSQTLYEGNEPKIGGLFDPRMGVLDNYFKILRILKITTVLQPHYLNSEFSEEFGVV